MLRLLAAAFCLMTAFPTWAQEWPAKPIRFVVPWPAGGLNDVIARTFNDRVSKALGQVGLVWRLLRSGWCAGGLRIRLPPGGQVRHLPGPGVRAQEAGRPAASASPTIAFAPTTSPIRS